MRFTDTIWEQAISPTFEAILAHPFLAGLTDGTLDEAAFRHYVLQDAQYLRDFARGLAVIAARAEDEERLMLFCDHAKNAIVVERALHAGFLADWGLSATEAEVEPAPTCLLSPSHLMRTAYTRPYAEALGASPPCYCVYWEVGKALVKKGSPHTLYQRWIDTYAGEEFATVVKEMLEAVDAACAPLTAAQRQAVAEQSRRAARFEWMFWDMGYHRQTWPV